MGSRDSWIDTDELSELGRQLLGAPGVPAVPHFGVDDGGGAPPDELVARWKRQLADIRARAERSGLLGEGRAGVEVASAAPGAVPVAFVPPTDGKLVARMRAFERWLEEAVRPLASFGADDLGFPILGGEEEPALVAAALSLCRAWHDAAGRAMGAPSAMASCVIENRGILSVFPVVEGDAFRFVALVTSRPVSSGAANVISAAFRAGMGIPVPS